MAETTPNQKPKLLSLGPINYADGGDGYMTEFKSLWDVDILKPKSQLETIADLKNKVLQDGPFQALMVHDLDLEINGELLTVLLPEIKIVVSASAGYNEFDVDFMTENGILFCNAIHAVSEATADLAVFLVLAVIRDTTRAEARMRSGLWRGGLPPTLDPNGMNLGILGMGSIGKHIARKIAAFHMNVHYYNRNRLSPEDEANYGVTYCHSLKELLSVSDVLTINCPLNSSTRGLLGKDKFALMKDGSFLVNTARGPIVDEEALIQAVRCEKICRAGLDVFANEPNVNPYFLECDRFTVIPHLGGMTVGTFKKAERECCENLKTWSDPAKTLVSVNKI